MGVWKTTVGAISIAVAMACGCGSATVGPGGMDGGAGGSTGGGADGAANGGTGGSAVFSYSVTLNGTQEGLSVTGTGTATVMLNQTTGAVTVTGSFTGLTGAATAAHIHGLATPPATAAVLLTLTPTAATAGTLMGSGTLNSTDVTGMIAGMTYLNIHTAANPAGEIRGDINAQGAP